MTEEETLHISNDKLIAEFMETKNVFPYIDRTEEFIGMYIADDEEGTIDYKYDINWLNYKEWNSLMPVVNKIEHIFETVTLLERFDINSHYARYGHVNDKIEIEFECIAGCYLESPEDIKFNTKEEATYYVVIEFIKWYNKTQKN